MTENMHRSSMAAERAADAIVKISWWVRVLTLGSCILTLAAVLTYIVVSNHQAADQRMRIQRELAQTAFIVGRVDQATDPRSQFSKRAAEQQALVVKNLILCLENHDDRLAAELANAAPPPVRPGCP